MTIDNMDAKRLADNFKSPENPFQKNYKKGCVNGK